MDNKQEFTNLWQAVKAAWGFSGKSSNFGRGFIVGETIVAIAGIVYSILPRVIDVPSSWIAFSGASFMFIALGELQFELWIKQRNDENRDVIIIGYRTISRFSMAIVFCAAMIMLS